MTFDKLAYIDRLKAAGFSESQARAMADLKSDFNETIDELLAAMKANRIYFLKWFATLIVGRTAVFTALKLLGH